MGDDVAGPWGALLVIAIVFYALQFSVSSICTGLFEFGSSKVLY
jgi:hypothetical protein